MDRGASEANSHVTSMRQTASLLHLLAHLHERGLAAHHVQPSSRLGQGAAGLALLEAEDFEPKTWMLVPVGGREPQEADGLQARRLIRAPKGYCAT